MKILKLLEKQRMTWCLIGLLSIFFLLRLPSLIEPDWYGDEGVYQIIGLAIHQGRHLYTDVWDNKPPLLYLIYALFSGNLFPVKVVSLLFGLIATILFFLLSTIVVKKNAIVLLTTSIFTLLFATPFLEGNIANAENFMLPLLIGAGILIYQTIHMQKSRYVIFFAGLLLGVAFLIKTVAIFDSLAFALFLLLNPLIKKRLQLKNMLVLFPLLVGFLLPLSIAVIFFLLQGTLSAFIHAAFIGNINYVNYDNTFIIPQGFLIIKSLILLIAFISIIWKRKLFSQESLFISFWFILDIFSALFSQRPYTHYALVLLPSFCLLIGLFIQQQHRSKKLFLGSIILIVSLFIFFYFPVFGINRTFDYYQNAIRFITGNESVSDYQLFFDDKTPRDYELASYLLTHSTTNDPIFIWGDRPQIYFLAHKLPLNKYVAAYHIIEEPNAIADTQEAIDKLKPKFIITLSEAPALPFSLPNYHGQYGIQDAFIYERTY